VLWTPWAKRGRLEVRWPVTWAAWVMPGRFGWASSFSQRMVVKDMVTAYGATPPRQIKIVF